MAEERQAAKAAILNELESIKGLLVEEPKDETPAECCEEVPTLQDPVADHKPYAPLPGQQSLFSEGRSEPNSDSHPEPNSNKPSGEPNTAKNETPLPADENPFLPKHIRDRLQGNKPHLGMQNFKPSELAKEPSELAKEPSVQQAQTRALVDELVTEYLPKMETELRQRLHKLIQTPDVD